MIEGSSFLEKVLTEVGISAHLLAGILISGFASIIVSLYRVRNGKSFKLINFVSNAFVAILMAYTVDVALEWYFGEYDKNLEKMIMVITGISANKMLEVIEENVYDFIDNKAKSIKNLTKKKK